MINIEISVIIPMYNAEKTIASVLESVLSQTYQGRIETIVVNDGSNDNCEEIVQKMIINNKTDKTIRLINKENGGVSSSRNYGIKESSGKYIAFLDSDDIWHPKKLELIIKLMKKNRISFLGHAYIVAEDFISLDESRTIKKRSFVQILIKNITQTSCIVIKKEICEYFNEDMTHTEDHELWLRMALNYDLYYLDTALTKLERPQLTQGGLSSNRWAMRKGEIQMYINIIMKKKILIPFLPFLVVFSLIKHFRNYIKDFV